MPKHAIKRQCRRFTIPGAVLHYRKKSFFFIKSAFSEDYFPVLDISRGGVCFLSQKHFPVNTGVTVKICLPDGSPPLILDGAIKWSRRDHGISYEYRNGVAFNPYGGKTGSNPLESLVRLKELEQSFDSAADEALLSG